MRADEREEQRRISVSTSCSQRCKYALLCLVTASEELSPFEVILLILFAAQPNPVLPSGTPIKLLLCSF